MKTRLAVLAVLSLMIGGTAPGRAAEQEAVPTLEEVLERHVDAVGGREAIEKLTTRVLIGRLVTDLPTRRPPVHESNGFVIYGKAPDMYLMVQQSGRDIHREGCDDRRCWSWSGGELRLDAHHDPRFAWFADPQGALRMWDHFPDMRLRGARTLQDRRVYRVDIDDDESHALFFDAETGLLVRLGYHREVDEYTEVDGVLVPFRMALSRKGGSSTYFVERVEHNVPLDDTELAAPVGRFAVSHQKPFCNHTFVAPPRVLPVDGQGE